MESTNSVERVRREMIETVERMLNGSISFIEGSRALSHMRFEAGLENDSAILPFVGIDSKTDALPLDVGIRKLWSPTALEKAQPDIDRLEMWAREFGQSHCQVLIARLKSN